MFTLFLHQKDVASTSIFTATFISRHKLFLSGSLVGPVECKERRNKKIIWKEATNVFTDRIYCVFATHIELACVWRLKPRLSEFLKLSTLFC